MGVVLFCLVVPAVCCALFGAIGVHLLRGHRAVRRLITSGVRTEAVCEGLSWHDDEVSVRFSYTLPDGTTHEADSYATGHTGIAPRDGVTAVYDPEAPTVAELEEHLESARSGRFRALVVLTPALAFFVVWLVIGIGVVAFA
ncbi:DUF3592 domain-containing protein [Streptomyces sp. NPDC008150]|uniref:DUF3592 domain-containing protein n=1 Tax=Streptomyces sp. NPDC008150 TaxID=3364816 RepID=UPI0036F15F72